MKKPLTWVPWYVDSWIFGSSRIELTRAQRSDFLDLVLLAGKDDGYIRANQTTPYPLAQLAGLLCINSDDLEETIRRCIEVGKIEKRENGVLYIVNWEAYKLTDRWRRKLEERDSSLAEEDITTKEASYPLKEEDSRVKETGTPFRKTGIATPDAIDLALDQAIEEQRKEADRLDAELPAK
jgi:hypothetical protein